MDNMKLGERVRIKDRPDWPTPPGYRLANSEGITVKICEWEEVLAEFPEYAKVKIEKTQANVGIGTTMLFRLENLEKI